MQIKSLLDNSTSFLSQSSDSSFKKANEAKELSRAAGNKKFILQSIILSGNITYIKGNTQQALEMYLQALKMAQRDNFPLEAYRLNFEIGKIFYNWGKYDTSENYFKKVLSYSETSMLTQNTNEYENNHMRVPSGFNNKLFSDENNNIKQLTSSALTYMGKYYMVNGNFKEALPYFKHSLIISRSINDYNQAAFILNTEGKYYIGEGNIISAFQCYQEAYDISEKINDKLLAAEVCNYLGGLYLQTNQFEKSLEYHRKAMHLRNFMDNPEGMAKSFNNIGKAYLELNKIDSACVYFNQSIAICKKTGYIKGLVKALSNLGKAYFKQNDTVKSEQTQLQAFEISEKAGYKLGIAESSIGLGDIYKKNLSVEKALKYYKISLRSLQNLNFDELLCDNYEGLYECYNSIRDYQNALKYNELLLTTEKKLLNVENHRQLAILQITYNTERKEKDNQDLRKENELKEMTIKRKSTFLWLIIALLFSSILFCLYIYNRFYSKSKANKRLEVLNSKIIKQNVALEKLNKELNLANDEKDKLFSIIAHELRNPLYWFQNLAEVLSKKYDSMSPDQIQKSLAALDESSKNAFHLMDNLLHWSRSKLNRIYAKKINIDLGPAILANIRMYETIMQYKNISLELNIPEGTIINADEDLFNCVIRNLMSNAIKYTPVNGTISIKCIENEAFHTIIVSDSGNGVPGNLVKKLFNLNENVSMPGLMNEKGSGFGLKLCKEFVELHGGRIWVENKQDQGSSFTFTIPKVII